MRKKAKNVWLEMDTFDRIIFTNITTLLNGDVQYLLAYLDLSKRIRVVKS